MATTTPMTEPTAFDTLSAANELREAGFDRKQAEALTRIVAKAHGALATEAGLHRLETQIDSRIDSLETKLDSKIDALGKRLDSRIDSLEEKVDSRFVAFEAKVDSRFAAFGAQIESRFTAFEVRMVRWLAAAVAIMLAAIPLGFGLMGFLIAD